MLPSVRAFLSQLIDYAGMFPPAQLPLEEALAHFLRERASSPHAWVLGRFVCPAARLDDAIKIAPALAVAALGTPGPDEAALLGQLETDLDAVSRFRGAGGLAETLELALPRNLPLERLAAVASIVDERAVTANVRIFLELPRQPSWRQGIEVLAACPASSIGMKLRCGGVSAEAFPPEADIAHFILRARDARKPWKATAGLHHPRRHQDATLDVWHHGFLNVFGAGLLARAHPLTEPDLIDILSDRTAEHFRFDPAGLSWKDWSCTTSQIAELRTTWATSFGSCSFAEPCDDLLALGLLK